MISTILQQAAQAADIPWSFISSGGAGVAAVVTLYLCLKHLGEQRKAAAEEMAAQRTEFTTTVRGLSTEFGQQVRAIADQVVSSNERVEGAMRDLTLEMRTGNRPPQA